MKYFCNINIRSFSSASASSAKRFVSEGKKDTNTLVSVNTITGERRFIKVEDKEPLPKKYRKEFNLPTEAIAGLRNAIITCERSAKQLQNEADQLTAKLEQRRFPESPEKVKAIRDEIKRTLRSSYKQDGNQNLDDDILGGKIKQSKEYHIRNEVDKLLKKSYLNWRPLEIMTKEEAASYSLARFAANYAEISRVLEEFKAKPSFSPKTVLDYGSGSGSGFWACQSFWGKSKIDEFTLVDTSDAMTRFTMDTIRVNNDDSKPFVHDNVNFRRNLIPSTNTKYDLIIAHRVLCEIGSLESRIQLVNSLWQRTNKYLVIIESAMPSAFSGILEIRDYLLTSGIQVDFNKLVDNLQESSQLTREILEVIENSKLSDFEKFMILSEKVPPEIKIPTTLPTGTVMAPCPHDLGCPLTERTSCSFSARYKTIRADGRKNTKESDGTELTKFSFIIIEKSNRKVNDLTERILKNRKLGGHVTCDVCTSFYGIQRMTLSKKKNGAIYSHLKSRRDGDILPAKLKALKTNTIFDVTLN